MKTRSSIVGGLIMIAVGVLFLLLQLFPGLGDFFDIGQLWPLLIMLVGLFFLVGAVWGTPPLAIPGSIVGGIGLILLYQNLTGHWDSWAYVWALIPGFVGIGLIIAGVLGRLPEQVAAGRRLLVISLVLFVVFALFFTGFGGQFGQFWPLALIGLGLWLLFGNKRPLRKPKSDVVK
ncbi:MAG: hypothetical protein KC423_24590 [Anaerolineales bacterium]|nr:hypothetical protein [Anaerolineales bacterium]